MYMLPIFKNILVKSCMSIQLQINHPHSETFTQCPIWYAIHERKCDQSQHECLLISVLRF